MEVDYFCKKCKANLCEEDHTTEFNDCGKNVSEEIVIGYKCHMCGYEHEY